MERARESGHNTIKTTDHQMNWSLFAAGNHDEVGFVDDHPFPFVDLDPDACDHDLEKNFFGCDPCFGCGPCFGCVFVASHPKQIFCSSLDCDCDHGHRLKGSPRDSDSLCNLGGNVYPLSRNLS